MLLAAVVGQQRVGAYPPARPIGVAHEPRTPLRHGAPTGPSLVGLGLHFPVIGGIGVQGRACIDHVLRAVGLHGVRIPHVALVGLQLLPARSHEQPIGLLHHVFLVRHDLPPHAGLQFIKSHGALAALHGEPSIAILRCQGQGGPPEKGCAQQVRHIRLHLLPFHVIQFHTFSFHCKDRPFPSFRPRIFGFFASTFSGRRHMVQ